MRILRRSNPVSAKRIIEYDKKHNVTKGEAIEDKPLSSYLFKSLGKKLESSDVMSHQTEDQVVASCTKWLRTMGWDTRTLFTGGIPIGGGRYATNPCKGIPDCIAFNRFENKMIWIEYKKSHNGIVSSEQQEWHHQLKRCGQTILIVTSLESLKEQLDGQIRTPKT